MRNRQFLKPIVPFINKDTQKLPNQQFDNELIWQAQPQPKELMSNNTGPSADSREATSPVTSSHPQTEQPSTSTAKSTINKQDQTIQMPDDDFDKGLSQSVRKVLDVRNNTVSGRTIPHQNKGTGPGRAPLCPKGLSPPISPNQTRSKRVKFSTKRYKQQY